MKSKYKPGDIVLGNWTLIRLIGEGSFGSVFEAERKEFNNVYKSAIKIITIPQSQAEMRSAQAEGLDDESLVAYFYDMVEEITNESGLLSRLKGTANIVSYEDHAVIEHENAIGWDIIIRMELLTPLYDFAKDSKVTKQTIIKLGMDICNALELCQKHNIVHRDIKLENIFVSESGDFKIGDFGIARTIEKTTSGLSKKGTYTYMAPEVYRDEAYGPNVDIYSLGIVLYRLLNDNRAPFLPEYPTKIKYTDQEKAKAKRFSGTPLPVPKNADGRLAEIVLKACAFDSKHRYSSPKQMRQELKDIDYSSAEALIIYPKGDEISVKSLEYAENTPVSRQEPSENESTASIFGDFFSHSEKNPRTHTQGTSSATVDRTATLVKDFHLDAEYDEREDTVSLFGESHSDVDNKAQEHHERIEVESVESKKITHTAPAAKGESNPYAKSLQKRSDAKKPAKKTGVIAAAALFAVASIIVIIILALLPGIPEVQAAIAVRPAFLMVSVMQSSEVQVTRKYEGEEIAHPMDAGLLQWDAVMDYVAQIDGNRVIGLNVGETTISGRYGGQEVEMRINVVEPIHGMVDISMRFQPGNMVRLFAGTAYLDRVDGDMNIAELVSPESMAVTENGAIYFADAGFLRRIYNGAVETIYINPEFLSPRLVRAVRNDLYILTHIWQDEDMYYVGIIRLSDDGMDAIFQGDAAFVTIRDMAVSDGYVYMLIEDTEMESTFLRTIDLSDTAMVRTLTEVPRGISSLYVRGSIVYMANEAEGNLVYFDGSRIVQLAGVEGENHFIDGTAPLFYRPTRIRYRNGALYVWDFNVLRRINLEGGIATETISVAGVASPEFPMSFAEQELAERIILPFSVLADFVHLDNGILLSDPRRGVVWHVEYVAQD